MECSRLLSFADFIVCNLPLKRALEALNFCTALLQMFLAHPTVDPFSPKVETAALERLPHKSNHISLGKPKLKQNGLKRGPVFPSHFNDAVLIDRVHGYDNNCLLKLLGRECGFQIHISRSSLGFLYLYIHLELGKFLIKSFWN